MSMESGWNIFTQDGKIALNFTSLISLEINDGARVVSHPVERGSFTSYNKVALPLSIEASLGLDSTTAMQQETLNTLGAFKHDASILAFSTPHTYYDRLTLENYRYKRSLESGSSILIVTVKLVEVRDAAYISPSAFSIRQCKNPSSVSIRDTGRAVISNFVAAGFGKRSS